jgi:hypothetical protein
VKPWVKDTIETIAVAITEASEDKTVPWEERLRQAHAALNAALLGLTGADDRSEAIAVAVADASEDKTVPWEERLRQGHAALHAAMRGLTSAGGRGDIEVTSYEGPKGLSDDSTNNG